jgi:hypothetical protein
MGGGMKPFKIAKVERSGIRKSNYGSGGTDMIRLTDDAGSTIELWLDGDCCSNSEFEEQSFTDLCLLVGETLLSVEEVDSDIEDEGNEVVWSALLVRTNWSSITVDWRNTSNGYYSGWFWMVDSREAK